LKLSLKKLNLSVGLQLEQ